MKIKNITNPQFFASLNKVMRAEIPVAVAWRLRGLAKHLEATHESYDTMRRELLDKHAEKDENGKGKADENGNVVFASDAAKMAFIADHQELLEQEVQLDKKIKISELGGISLSVSDLFVLEDLIED